jgi:hypothetical protein
MTSISQLYQRFLSQLFCILENFLLFLFFRALCLRICGEVKVIYKEEFRRKATSSSRKRDEEREL